MKPSARQERLVAEQVGEELVVYDLERHRVHHLNRAAALVWQNCDGQKSIGELKKVLQTKLNPKADEGIVWTALERLGKAHLLTEAVSPPATMTRRQAFRKFGRVAALALLVPVVKSIVAPDAVKAAFGGPFFDCGGFYCAGVVCRDQCQFNFQCGFSMQCTVMPCNQFPCLGCSQRRCVPVSSPFRAPSGGSNVNPDSTPRSKKA
ncbi:MAG TPA: PqqD family protein [Gemmataceae bacterium]|nr:PqqD family protein [Gemmataceae bacterium]